MESDGSASTVGGMDVGWRSMVAFPESGGRDGFFLLHVNDMDVSEHGGVFTPKSSIKQ